MGPRSAKWIVSVVVISLGPGPVTLTVSVLWSSVGSQPCHMDCECVVVISWVPALSYGLRVCGGHQLGSSPAIWTESVVIISLGPGAVIWILSV